MELNAGKELRGHNNKDNVNTKGGKVSTEGIAIQQRINKTTKRDQREAEEDANQTEQDVSKVG